MHDRILLGELPVGTSAPNEFRILASGENGTRNGYTIVFDEESAKSVLAEFDRGGVDLSLDFEHAMADPGVPPSEKRARGWFRPAVRNGELWATEVTWTPTGRAAVEAREFRYTSLWGSSAKLDKDGKRRRLLRLVNVALTNTPATLQTLPLVANEGQQGSNSMSDISRSPLMIALSCKDEAEAIERVSLIQTTLSEVAVVLGVDASKHDSIRGAVRALKLQADRAKEFETRLADIEAKAQADKKAGLVAKLTEAGKLPPALHAWAATQSYESLSAFGELAPAYAPTSPVQSNSSGVTTTLTEDERKVARMLGQSEDAALKEKIRLAAQA